MKKLLIPTLFTLGSSLFTLCEAQVTKMDFFLATKNQAYQEKKKDANVMLPMLVKGNISAIKQLVQKDGGKFNYSAGNIAAVSIPVSALPDFNQSKDVTRMEGTAHRFRTCNDSMRVKNHFNEVLNGQSPLPKAYNGKGVVIGFVDTGIDILHEDFRNADGTTRVKYYWDQNRYDTSAYTPQPYGYGQAWDSTIINLALPMTTASDSTKDSASRIDFGHGTSVAGSAVGNGRCNGHQMGGCPDADIIFVALNFNSSNPNLITDAINYIYTCADSLNEPCVINLSLGEYDGSHDDSDMQGEMIDAMLAAKQPGRVCVAAAGNEGVPYHVHDSITSTSTPDTTFTWFKVDGGIYDIPVFANEADFKNVRFKIRCDKVQTGSFFERDTDTYSTIANWMGMKTTNVYNAHGQILGVINSYGQVYTTGSYSLEFQITADTAGYDWGFEATGTGKFDIWDFYSKNDVVDSTGLKIPPAKYPEILKYQQPDTLMTLCSSFQCSPHVITAQTYFNRKTWKGCNNLIDTNTNKADVPGAFVWGTSKGPTRNYARMKPDVSASGNTTMSAFPTWLKSCSVDSDTLECHYVDGGTSMASPMVAATAALYLCRYPHATDSNVWRCITQTAYRDNFTGTNLPNANWGYGKVDAFAALTQCAPTAINEVEVESNQLLVYPNPSKGLFTFQPSVVSGQLSVKVYNVLGEEVYSQFNIQHSTFNINLSNQPNGVYFYRVVSQTGEMIGDGKLVVQK